MHSMQIQTEWLKSKTQRETEKAEIEKKKLCTITSRTCCVSQMRQRTKNEKLLQRSQPLAFLISLMWPNAAKGNWSDLVFLFGIFAYTTHTHRIKKATACSCIHQISQTNQCICKSLLTFVCYQQKTNSAFLFLFLSFCVVLCKNAKID